MRNAARLMFGVLVLFLVTGLLSGCNRERTKEARRVAPELAGGFFKSRPLTVEEYSRTMAPYWYEVVQLRRQTQDQIWTELRNLVSAGKEDEALEFSRRMGEQQSHTYMALLSKIVGITPPQEVMEFHTNFIRFLAYSELASRLTADLQGRPEELAAASQVAEKSNLLWKSLVKTGQDLFGEAKQQ